LRSPGGGWQPVAVQAAAAIGFAAFDMYLWTRSATLAVPAALVGAAMGVALIRRYI